MTRVDFYRVAERSVGDRFVLACRLAEKVHAQGLQVYAHAASKADAEKLDRLLWTFRQQSFLPHGLVGDSEPSVTSIVIGWDSPPPEAKEDVLINLAPEVPPFFSRFDRVVEPVDDQPEHRDQGRARYRFYRDRGYPLHYHEIKL